MLRILRSKRAQSTAEYAIVIGLVIGLISAMQIYVKRSLQSRIRGGTDFLSSNSTVHDAYQLTGIAGDGTNRTGQYEPYYLTSDMTSTQQGKEIVDVTGNVFTKTIPSDTEKQIFKRPEGGVQTYEAPDAK